MNLLLVAYFYPAVPRHRRPPARRDGEVAAAARARVTVLTTSAYGAATGDEEDVVRTTRPPARCARGCTATTASTRCSTPTPTRARPHPLSKVIVPEPLVVAWAPFAHRAALRLNARERFDCVITSSPPESAHPSAGRSRAAASPGSPTSATRGPSSRSARRFRPGLQRRLDERLERRWLGAADAVVCVSRPAAEDLRERLGIDPVLVPNGWDPDLVGRRRRPPTVADRLLDPERISLVYTGRFGSYGRDPTRWSQALGDAGRRAPDAAARLELVVAGPLTEDEAALCERDVSPARIVVAGTLARDRALAPAARRRRAAAARLRPRAPSSLNFKLFEYLAAGPPILALAAGTEAGRVVAEAGGEAVPADDLAAIVGALRRLVAGEIPPPDPEARERYSYPRVAERMAAVAQQERPPAPRVTLGPVPAVLICADTIRSPEMRHEVPAEIMDPFLYAEVDGRRYAVVSQLETYRRSTRRRRTSR